MIRKTSRTFGRLSSKGLALLLLIAGVSHLSAAGDMPAANAPAESQVPASYPFVGPPFVAQSLYGESQTFTRETPGIGIDSPITQQRRSGTILVTDTISPEDDLDLPFGEVAVGAAASTSVTIRNSSPTEPLTISSIQFPGFHFDNFQDGIAQHWQPLIRPDVIGSEWQVVNGTYQGGPSNLTLGFKETAWRQQLLQNVELTVTARHLAEPNKYCYLLARNTPNGATGSSVGGPGYAFGFTATGSIIGYRRSSTGVLTEILPARATSALRPAPESNTVSLIVDGSILTLVVNGYEVARLNDNSISAVLTAGGFALAHDSELTGATSPIIAIDEITIRDLDANSTFNLTGLPDFPTALSPESNLTIDVSAQPISLGTVYGQLHILSSDSEFPTASIDLTVTGIPTATGTMHFSDSVAPVDDRFVDFGVISTGFSANQSITIGNSHPEHPLELEGLLLFDSVIEPFDGPTIEGWTTFDAWIADGEMGIRAAPPIFPNLWYPVIWEEQGFGEGRLAVDILHTVPNSNTSAFVFVRGSDNFYPFSNGSALGIGMTRSGFYNIGIVDGMGYEFLQSWTLTNAIKNDGTPNRVEIEWFGTRLIVRFNSITVFDGIAPPRFAPAPTATRVTLVYFTGATSELVYFDDVRLDRNPVNSPFTLTSPGIPLGIAPGSSVTVPASFAPLTSGRFHGMVRVGSDAFTNGTGEFLFTGIGGADSVLWDLTGDGIVNVADVTRLANALNGIGEPVGLEGDVNGDGSINEQDVEALAALIVQ